jgi:SagB-type dehydrogenase family enzyme
VPFWYANGRSVVSQRSKALVAIASLVIGEACMADEQLLPLPAPALESEGCLNTILRARRTIRAFASQPLSLEGVGLLLWAAQGVTSHEGFRTAPSAGALYPLELHLVAGDVVGLAPGSYRYDPVRHALRPGVEGDRRSAIAAAALGQTWIAQAPAIVVISAVESRTTAKYGRRGIRYVHMEVGHAGQNLLLQAVALGLAGAIVGAFDGDGLGRLLGLPVQEHPLAIVPVGHARDHPRN